MKKCELLFYMCQNINRVLKYHTVDSILRISPKQSWKPNYYIFVLHKILYLQVDSFVRSFTNWRNSFGSKFC